MPGFTTFTNIHRWQVSEGSNQHDYAENFENYSDGIEEVPEVDSEGEAP